MKTYLVTGGAGFIGSNFIHYVIGKYKNIKIINVDKPTYAGNLENLKEVEGHEYYQFVKADICDREAIEEIFNENDIDYVVNFAAESHVDRSIADPEIFVKTNVLGTLNLLNIAKKHWLVGDDQYQDGKKFLQVSTDEVYGSLGETGFFEETTPLDPHSPYSSSKASADLMVKAYFDTYKMPMNITRCSNNYGSYQFPEKLIPLVINNCLNHREIPVYGDGLNIRDWLYVEDHCKAIDMVINQGKLGEVYNVGGHNERTNIHLVKTIVNYINKNVDASVTEDLIKFVQDRKGHDRRYGIDPTKIKDEINWEPETTFEVGIVKTIEWYLNNKEWLDNITNGTYKEYYKQLYKVK
ncbi:dTDP-glucose 4,6-dehydratase [Bacillus toyonensis]|uniref:dTDP-glucose 4,6-dehydratase n=1 Tax=Bacillus toyonensis TaxID=155322 RepID=UPI000BF3D0DD|nr:dTDP-glucose 4,6-dehydratase [Bacillus toyonensis]PGD05763.1 dTDP-glucose 4,6-dehydratase [Bacillus toyonensis]PGE71909.1 dTDP-glucose 4,6-dehydratase [Bacillus toyonensis]PHD42884.1 dTDP-glucose 4,6-dehydratase [Bacillus toyonensis]